MEKENHNNLEAIEEGAEAAAADDDEGKASRLLFFVCEEKASNIFISLALQQNPFSYDFSCLNPCTSSRITTTAPAAPRVASREKICSPGKAKDASF